jgi:hypothetical protein
MRREKSTSDQSAASTAGIANKPLLAWLCVANTKANRCDDGEAAIPTHIADALVRPCRGDQNGSLLVQVWNTWTSIYLLDSLRPSVPSWNVNKRE